MATPVHERPWQVTPINRHNHGGGTPPPGKAPGAKARGGSKSRLTHGIPRQSWKPARWRDPPGGDGRGVAATHVARSESCKRLQIAPFITPTAHHCSDSPMGTNKDNLICAGRKVPPTNVGTWNVRTLSQDGQELVLRREFAKYNMAVTAITEPRWLGTGTRVLEEGWVMIHSGPEKGQFGGVAIVMSPAGAAAWRAAESEHEAVNDRILTARFAAQHLFITIVAVYAPTDLAEPATKDEFFNRLQAVVDGIRKDRRRKRDVILMLGDFNAKVGSSMAPVVGPHGMGNRMNDNGERLITFALRNELICSDTWFCRKDIHKVTWVSPGGKYGAMLDHDLISRRWRTTIEDVKTRRGADFGSDHYLVQAKMRIHWSTCRRPPRPVVLMRQASEQKDQYQKLVAEKLGPADTAGSVRHLSRAVATNKRATARPAPRVDERWQKMKEAMQQASTEFVKAIPRRPRKPWISKKTWDLIEEKKKAHRKRLKVNSPENNRKYWGLQKETRKSLREGERKRWEGHAKEMEESAAQGRTRDLFHQIRALGNTRKAPISQLKRGGKTAKTQKDIADVFTEHFQAVLNVKHGHAVPVAPVVGGARARFQHLERTPSLTEVRKAIQGLRSHSAAGPDGILPEMIKWGDEPLAVHMWLLLTDIWEEERTPAEWSKATLIPLHKKGDHSNPDNYRGIALLSVAGKVLTRLLNARLQEVVEATVMEEQCGFRKGRGTVDQMFVAR